MSRGVPRCAPASLGLAAWRCAWRAAASPAAPLCPIPTRWLVELDRALALRKALVLMVSLDGCPYCKLVRDSPISSPLREAASP